MGWRYSGKVIFLAFCRIGIDIGFKALEHRKLSRLANELAADDTTARFNPTGGFPPCGSESNHAARSTSPAIVAGLCLIQSGTLGFDRRECAARMWATVIRGTAEFPFFEQGHLIMKLMIGDERSRTTIEQLAHQFVERLQRNTQALAHITAENRGFSCRLRNLRDVCLRGVGSCAVLVTGL